ncbi:hypothetical protein [Paenibacillus sonchi]|uniref:hypothetical protein n=1 Tax=Paenibacillus sonchi TaxID=373687 RepID=UPI001E46B954|nr:hypothetical protein [Paenibacillus sonchi]MCE3203291.1 hypothetical protein [Paenibacillus sonchi]
MGNPLKEFKSSIDGLKQSLDGVKQYYSTYMMRTEESTFKFGICRQVGGMREKSILEWVKMGLRS